MYIVARSIIDGRIEGISSRLGLANPQQSKRITIRYDRLEACSLLACLCLCIPRSLYLLLLSLCPPPVFTLSQPQGLSKVLLTRSTTLQRWSRCLMLMNQSHKDYCRGRLELFSLSRVLSTFQVQRRCCCLRSTDPTCTSLSKLRLQAIHVHV